MYDHKIGSHEFHNLNLNVWDELHTSTAYQLSGQIFGSQSAHTSTEQKAMAILQQD